MRRIATVAALVIGCASPLFGDGPKHQWRYSILTEVSIPSIKKTTWICKDNPKIAENATEPDALDAMGALGWELVWVRPLGGGTSEMTSFYFKQPK